MGFQLAQKLKFLKKQIQVWRRKVFGCISEKKHHLLSEIQSIDGKYEGDWNRNISLKEQFRRLIFQEEISWKQRSRNKWLAAGDRNMRFFHAVASTRRRVNRKNAIEVGGRLWEEKPDIENEIVHFFQTLYSSDYKLRPQMDGIFGSQFSTSTASSLEVQFSKEEIRQAVFGLGGDRASGPDGFLIAFFHYFWDMLEDEMLACFNEFQEHGVMARELGVSFIALIPKKDGDISIKEFQPISLIGSLYKILTKVLANCLRKVLLEV